jgi:beta-lactamase regulating signal transducer with metallopeptidase domain
MIAAWILYLTIVSTLFALAAHSAELILRLAGKAGRGAWVIGIVLTCLVPLIASARSSENPTLINRSDVVRRDLGDTREGSSTETGSPVPYALTVTPNGALSALDRPLLGLWIAGGLFWLATLIGSAIRLSAKARGWRPAVVDGIPVLLSHDTGPALVGAIFPQIVVPTWIVDLPVEQRVLLLTHEREHARSHDPLLLHASALAVIAMAWNPVLWYSLGRLRLAIEADCDRLVLRKCPDVRTYSSLLLDVSERIIVSAAPIAAFAEPTSHLKRRLSLMYPSITRFLALRLACAFAVTVIAGTLAAQTPRPTELPRRPTRDSIAAIRESNRKEAQRRREAFERVVPDSVIHRAIVTHYPSALTGGMGSHPLLWFLADSKGDVLRTSTGRAGLSRWSYTYLRDSMPSFLLNLSVGRRAEIEANGIEYLDAAAARRKFPELMRLSAPDGLTTVMTSIKGTPVEVAWIQLAPGSALP